MDKTPLEAWIEKWGINLDWEANAKLREVVQEGEKMSEQTMEQRVSTLEKEIAEQKVQVSVRNKTANDVTQQFINLITKNGLTFQEATNCFRWARWNVFNEGGMPTGDNPILKDQ